MSFPSLRTSFSPLNSFYSSSKIHKYYLNQSPPFETDSSSKFTDDLFPPNDSSLLSKDKKGMYLDRENGAKNVSLINTTEISWKRLSDIYPENYLFEDNIDFEDIRQGKIGNCYFLSALASMTEYPNLLSQLFKTKSQNSQCYWEIILFIDGEFQIVVIDDYVPIIKNTNDLYFCKPNNKELWVVLLEKAWAKVNGGYTNIISGWPSDVMGFFTGYSTSYLIHDNYNETCDDLFNTIDNFDKGNCVICASTRGDDDSIEKKGLIKGHTYSLLNTYNVELKNGSNELLLQLLNPWGYREWIGNYSDSSSKWNDVKNKDDLLINARNTAKTKGSFFISINDFQKYFIRTDICHIMFDCNLSLHKIESNELTLPNVYNLYIPEDNTTISISLIKEHWRNHRELSTTQFPATLILMKYNDDPNADSKFPLINFYGDYHSCDNCNINISSLSQGFYIIFTYIAYNYCLSSKPNFAVLKIMSNSNYKLSKVDTDNLDSFELLKKMILCGYIQQNKVNIYNKKEIFHSISNNFCNSGIGYRIVINPLKHNYQKWNNVTNEIVNMFLLPPYDNNANFQFTVYPNSEVVILGMKKETYGSYWFNLKSSMKMYKNSNELLDPNANNFNINDYLPLMNLPENELNSNYKYDYTSLSLNDAKYRKTYTKQEINKLMISELQKRENNLMDLLLALPPLNDNEINEDELIWVYVQKENGFYIGQALDNVNKEQGKVVRYGRGAFKYNDDNISFVGYWKNNLKVKEGVIYGKEFDIVFKGVFENGLRNGKGELKFVNGDKYVGMFRDDVREGKGVYYWKDGSRWEGEFKNNVMNGNGMYYAIDGDTFEANYENGEYIE